MAGCRLYSQKGKYCVIPEYRVGRIKGTKVNMPSLYEKSYLFPTSVSCSKRAGLDKAVSQIHRPLNRSKVSDQIPNGTLTTQLQVAMSNTDELLDL